MDDENRLCEFVMDMLGVGYLLVRFVAFLLPLAFLLLIGFLFGRIT